MRGKRYSRQRELIYQQLCQTTEHPTAEMLFQWLKPDNPALSLGTVYRNLNLLSDEGIIARMSFPVERYDANTKPHPHFICSVCRAVSDIDLPYDPSLDEQAHKVSGNTVQGHDLLFTGTCAECMETKK